MASAIRCAAECRIRANSNSLELSVSKAMSISSDSSCKSACTMTFVAFVHRVEQQKTRRPLWDVWLTWFHPDSESIDSLVSAGNGANRRDIPGWFSLARLPIPLQLRGISLGCRSAVLVPVDAPWIFGCYGAYGPCRGSVNPGAISPHRFPGR